MFNVVICDDDKKLTKEYRDYVSEMKDKIYQLTVYNSAQELYDDLNFFRKSFDIFLLDIEIGDKSGIDLAKKIRENDKNAIIIFLTSYPQYALDTFQVVTFDFLVKPVTKEKMQTVLNKAIEYISLSKQNFSFSFKKDRYSIPFNKICYIQKRGRKAYIYTDKKTYECNLNLKKIWEKLEEKSFASIGNSCIVNISKIEEIQSEHVILENDKKLVVSREYRTALKKKHLEYYREQM